MNDTSSSSPLDEWRFLIGTWKGTSKGQFGEKGVIEGVAVFSSEPSEAFIMEKGEGSSEGHFVNRSISLLFYDNVEQKFRRKTFFSYGFVNNELECSRDKNEIKFDTKMEPLPKNFEGTRWRSFIRKTSDTKIAMAWKWQRKEKNSRNMANQHSPRSNNPGGNLQTRLEDPWPSPSWQA